MSLLSASPKLHSFALLSTLLCGMACMLAAPGLPAQNISPALPGGAERSVAGIVTDPHHEPLRGAIVELQEGDSANIVSFVTGEDGKYHFLRLKANQDYRVWAKFRERRSHPREISKFDDKPLRVIDFTLESF